MAGKVVFVLIDAVGFQDFVDQFGTLEGLVEGGLARRWKMRTVLPTLSLPVYETLHTGVPPHEHGIRSNDCAELSKVPNVFTLARAASRKTAAVAHYSFSELYNGAPYRPLEDMETDDESRNVQHGRFYSELNYTSFNLNLPSEHDLTTQASILIKRHAPDYLLLHTFSPDAVGHAHGADSKQFRHQCWAVDNALAEAVPLWLEEGYRVLITADHGMTGEGRHGGTSEAERMVAFYDVGHPVGGVADQVVSQLAVAPTILALMGLDRPATMQAAPLSRLD